MVLAAEGKAVLRMARCGVETWPDDPGSSSLLVRRFHRALTLLEGPVDVKIQNRRAYIAVAGDSPPAVLAWCGTMLPLLLRPSALAPIPLTAFGNMLQLVGGLLVLAATLRLGRSFGIVAANRGIQTGGLYRVVRHPIYSAYVLAFGGFVLAHPTLSNVVILAGWLMVQVLRVRAEECLLMQDEAYTAYATRVRYRLIPGCW